MVVWPRSRGVMERGVPVPLGPHEQPSGPAFGPDLAPTCDPLIPPERLLGMQAAPGFLHLSASLPQHFVL